VGKARPDKRVLLALGDTDKPTNTKKPLDGLNAFMQRGRFAFS
jgi:hypothetical protein